MLVVLAATGAVTESLRDALGLEGLTAFLADLLNAWHVIAFMALGASQSSPLSPVREATA